MDDITLRVKQMYEKYPFPGSNVINLFHGNRLKRDLFSRKKNADHLRILDAGCGSGEKAVSLAKVFRTSEIVGWDISASSIQKAKELAAREKLKNIRFEEIDLINTDISKYHNNFDVIVAWGVIHHLSKPEEGLRNLGFTLKTDGLFYVWLYALYSLERFEISLFRQAIRLLLKKEGFSYESGIRVSQAIKGLLKTVAYGGKRDFLMRIKWFFNKDADKKQLILHLLKNPWSVKYASDYDVNAVDLFLHAYENDYDVNKIFEATDRAGLEVVDFIDLPKEIEAFVKSEYVKDLYYSLDLKDRLMVMECLCKPDHHFFVARKGTPESR
jgi:SAM-dependent methyltransferase